MSKYHASELQPGDNLVIGPNPEAKHASEQYTTTVTVTGVHTHGDVTDISYRDINGVKATATDIPNRQSFDVY